jgi:hypothetical protein
MSEIGEVIAVRKRKYPNNAKCTAATTAMAGVMMGHEEAGAGLQLALVADVDESG